MVDYPMVSSLKTRECVVAMEAFGGDVHAIENGQLDVTDAQTDRHMQSHKASSMQGW